MPYQFKKIWIRGMQRKLSLSNLIFPLRLLVSLFQCAFLVLSFKPNAVIGTGGYVSGPALMMGIAFGIPTIIQEQNSYPGLVNRFLGNWVKQVHVSFEDSIKYFKKQKNIFVSGNPVRGEFNKIDKANALSKFNLDSKKITLLIFGGSQGAHAINKTILAVLDRLMALPNLQLLWATGPNDFEKVKSIKTGAVSVHPYIEDMASAYRAADFVFCRSGASTLSEIAICGLPCILVPYPYSAAGHQVFNARAIEKAGSAIVILESELNEDSIIESVSELLSNSKKREKMSKAALELAKPNAAAEIVTKIADLI